MNLITNKKKEMEIKLLSRFGISGLIFTFLGPFLFWLAYPLGPLYAVIIADVLVHAIRFLSFKKFVFKKAEGYTVSVINYVISAMPITFLSLIIVSLLKGRLDRTMLTIVSTFIIIVISFSWSRFVYSRNVSKKFRAFDYRKISKVI